MTEDHYIDLIFKNDIFFCFKNESFWVILMFNLNFLISDLIVFKYCLMCYLKMNFQFYWVSHAPTKLIIGVQLFSTQQVKYLGIYSL